MQLRRANVTHDFVAWAVVVCFRVAVCFFFARAFCILVLPLLAILVLSLSFLGCCAAKFLPSPSLSSLFCSNSHPFVSLCSGTSPRRCFRIPRAPTLTAAAVSCSHLFFGFMSAALSISFSVSPALVNVRPGLSVDISENVTSNFRPISFAGYNNPSMPCFWDHKGLFSQSVPVLWFSVGTGTGEFFSLILFVRALVTHNFPLFRMAKCDSCVPAFVWSLCGSCILVVLFHACMCHVPSVVCVLCRQHQR